MANVPPDMMANGRQPDPHFDETEQLYRRFSRDCLDGEEIAIAAVELPDMSVIRQKYGSPEWLLLEDEFANWGVLYFLVRDIPPKQAIWHDGVIRFVLEPTHVPFKHNYPHAEVWLFRDNMRVCREKSNLDLLDPDFHLRWRECIVFASKVAVHPTQGKE